MFLGGCPAANWTGHAIKLRTTNFAKSAATVAAADAAAAVTEKPKQRPWVCAWGFVKLLLFGRFQNSAHRPNVGFLNVSPSKQRTIC